MKKNIIRAALNKANSERVLIEHAAQKIQLPESTPAWLDDMQSFTDTMPEHLPQKQTIRKRVRIARKCLNANDEQNLRVTVYRISRDYENAIEDMHHDEEEQRHLKTIDGGRKGGSAPKRKKWAEMAAERLIMESKGAITQEQAWQLIPESTEPWESETLEADYYVYRDENKIIATDQETKQEDYLTKSTFFKNYYRMAKNGG